MRKTVVLIILGFLLTACGPFALKHKMEAVMSSKIVIFDELFDMQKKHNGVYTPIIMFGSNRINGLTVPHMLEEMRLAFPVYLDPKNEFLETNPSLAKDQRLHSVLVDGRGKPVMIGNPIDSPKLKGLFEEYLQTISNQ